MSIGSISSAHDVLLPRHMLDALVRSGKLLLTSADLQKLGFGSRNRQRGLVASGIIDPPVKVGASCRRYYLASSIIASLERLQVVAVDDPERETLRGNARKARAARMAKKRAAALENETV